MEIFQYEFMARAFIAGILISFIAPLIGTFLVARRYSLIADTLSHVSLAGVALGLLLGIYPTFTALIVSIIASILIEKLRGSKKISGEEALAMFLSGGLAVAIVLIGLAKGFNVDLFSYLFGSITTVREIDLVIVSVLGIAVLTLITAFYKELVYVSFDEEAAKVSGLPVGFLNFLLMVLTAVTVSLSMRIVGVLLIGALMVIPVVTAIQLQTSFKNNLLISILISFLSVVTGLFVSFYLNLPAGGTIVLTSLGFFVVIQLITLKAK